MGMKKRIAVLTAQIEEYVQTEFLHGFIKSAFEHKFDVSVFAMLQKMQSTLSREYGDSSIYDLINFDLFDAVVIIPDTILSAGILRDLVDKIKAEYDGPVFSIDREISERLETSLRNFIEGEFRNTLHDTLQTDISGELSGSLYKSLYDALYEALFVPEKEGFIRNPGTR